MSQLLKVEALGRRIETSWIWRQVSLEIDSGGRVGVVGPSGAGKSLFLRALAGLDDVQEGAVRLLGTTQAEWSMPEYRTRVVYLHQRPALLEGSVEDNLRAVFSFSVHRGRKYERRSVLSWFEQLGRSESFLKRESASLSGGEAQMVALVRALQLEPLLLLFDEPTASLDADNEARIEELIEGWQASEDQGRAFLLTSHDREQVARLCSQTLSLEARGAS